MLGASRCVLLFTVVAAAMTVGDVSARTIRRSCRDGATADRAERSGQGLVACDVGATCDDACTFELPVCGPESCQTEAFTVPAGRTRRERLVVSPGAAPATLVLRCRPALRRASCIVVTTTTVTTTTSTTGFPGGPSGPITTTSVRLVGPSTTSSTTVASTSSTIPIPTTTTLLVIPSRIPCGGDVDCDGLATACAVGFCADDGFCAQACFCLTTNRGPTCSPDVARPCLTPNDCLDADQPDRACRVCYLNRCTIALAPECFPVLPAQSPGFTIGFGVGTVGGVQTSIP
ncbi:MAG TPA: hypothetical protein VMS22_08625 [Candidatus Eisenbacteria bacterium]|nr:hypothetical protein [Candidatus Eisenbacteria bacterium]